MVKNIGTLGMGFVMMLSSCEQLDTSEYLNKVIDKIENIHTVEYHGRLICWNSYDNNPLYDLVYLHHEYDNPADTIVGVSYAWFVPSEGMRFEGGYDGKVRMLVYDEHKGIMVDDFSTNRSYRPVNPPFFNMTKNILKYAIETTDSITTTLVDEDSCFHFSMTIHEEKQVIFVGKPFYVPNTQPDVMEFDPTSHYEVWISKSTNLPYIYKRTMYDYVYSEECFNPVFNKLSLDDFNLYEYIPEDYEVRDYNASQKKKGDNKNFLQDKPAPEWTLTDIHDNPVSLADIKSKVVLLNFTGIGCGACQVAIPFLKELKAKYSPEDFELIAIESWSGKTTSRRGYAEKKELNYQFLGATEEVLKEYKTGRAAPWFFLLDENHIVRKIFYGYSEERTSKEIKEAIETMLKSQPL